MYVEILCVQETGGGWVPQRDERGELRPPEVGRGWGVFTYSQGSEESGLVVAPTVTPAKRWQT